MEFINQGIEIEDDAGYTKVERYNDESTENLTQVYYNVLNNLGDDPDREGLKKTPLRVAKAMQFLTQGYDQDPEKILKSALFEEEHNEMIIVKDVELYSLCEHHLLPFFGKAHVAYIPNGYITGLSKIAHIVEVYSRRLQVQERMTQQIRDVITNTLNPLGVGVVVEAQHMCMQMRGVQKQNSVTTTSSFSGQFEKQETRNEFFSLIGSKLH